MNVNYNYFHDDEKTLEYFNIQYMNTYTLVILNLIIIIR